MPWVRIVNESIEWKIERLKRTPNPPPRRHGCHGAALYRLYSTENGPRSIRRQAKKNNKIA